MAVHVITNPQVLLGGQDVTCDTDTIGELDATCDMVQKTTFCGGGFRHYMPGLNAFRAGFSGFADYVSGGIGQAITAANAGDAYAIQIAPQAPNGTTTAGDVAIIQQGRLQTAQMPTGAVGDAARFDIGLTSTGGAALGYVGAPHAEYTTAGLTGTAVALTGPTADQKLYAALNVTAAAGTNLAVTIESDSSGAFSTPTTRITFSTVSATGWQFLSIDGDLSTETHWRVVATIGTSTFTFACAFGVA